MFMLLLLWTSTHKQKHLWKEREGCHRPILEIIPLCFLLWFNTLCSPLLTTFLHLLLLSTSVFLYMTVYFSSLVQQCWWLWQITNVCLVLGFSCSPYVDAGVGATICLGFLWGALSCLTCSTAMIGLMRVISFILLSRCCAQGQKRGDSRSKGAGSDLQKTRI